MLPGLLDHPHHLIFLDGCKQLCLSFGWRHDETLGSSKAWNHVNSNWMVVIMTLLLPYFSVFLDNLSFIPLLLIKGIFTHFCTDYYFVLSLVSIPAVCLWDPPIINKWVLKITSSLMSFWPSSPPIPPFQFLTQGLASDQLLHMPYNLACLVCVCIEDFIHT